MTIEEAIKEIEYNGFQYNGNIFVDSDAVYTLLNAVIKQDKYKWHDLRKNPDDFPKEDGAYWVYGDWGSGKKSEGECEFHVHDGYFRTSWNFNVIAWKYVDPFKEDV